MRLNMYANADISKAKLIQVGYVSSAHNLKGEVFVRLFAGRADWLKSLDQLVFVKSGLEMAVPVRQARAHKDGLIVATDRISDRTQAESMVGHQVFIPEQWLVADSHETPYLHELLNFEVIDEQLGPIGPIESFSTNGAQDLFVVHRGGREILIPFVKAFVQKLDFSNKTVHMSLPSGLIDLQS